MISSDLGNMLFTSFAKFVSRLTDREVKFQKLNFGEGMPGATLKINQFLKDATEAFDNPMLKKLGVLEPGKIYCLQADAGTTDLKLLTGAIDYLTEQGVRVIIIDKDMNFVSIPEGYEMVKKEDG